MISSTAWWPFASPAPTATRGSSLTGTRRTLDQARALDLVLERRSRTLDHVLLLDVADAVLIERITGRRADPETGRVYHVRFDPPPAAVAGRLVQRSDDTEEVLARRLAEYHGSTDLILPYYESRRLLRRIDGTGSMEQVRRRALEVLRAAPAPAQAGRQMARAHP